jgi:hypothetical protein
MAEREHMRRRLVLINVVLCGLLCCVAWAYGFCLSEGKLVYAIDDAYIHIANARNLAETGVWGIRGNEYAFCSSSPVWTLVLAFLFKVFGSHECIPGIVAFCSCLGCAAIVSQILLVAGLDRKMCILLGVMTLLAIPVTTPAILGMEHALHVLCVLALLYLYVADAGSLYAWLSLAAIAVGVRYESLFVIMPFGAGFLLTRRYRLFIALVIGALVPVCAYGIYAAAHGGYFLPNSLVVKAVVPTSPSGVWGKLTRVLLWDSATNFMVNLAMVTTAAVASCSMVRARVRFLAAVLSIASAGHLLFARTGWTLNVNRYELYLLASSFVVVATASTDAFKRHSRWRAKGDAWLWGTFVGAASVLFLSVMTITGAVTGVNAFDAMRETYETPMTAARIFGTLPTESQGPIYVNDLGLIAARTRVPIIDVCGLGEQETLELILSGNRDAEGLCKVLKRRHARYASAFSCFGFTKQVLESGFGVRPVAVINSPKTGVWVDSPLCLYALHGEDEKLLAKHISHLPFKLPSRASIQVRPDLLED